MNDNVYYNADLINLKFIDDGAPNPAIRFSQARQNGYVLVDPSSYQMSIIRWSLELNGALPLFIPLIQPNQPNLNQTIYNITLTYNGHIYTTPLIYTCYNSNLFPTNVTDHSNTYYWMRSYGEICTMINTNLKMLYDEINTTFGTRTTKCPKFAYNPQTLKFELFADCYGFGESDRLSNGNTNDENFIIYFDSNLERILKNFQFSYEGNDVSTNKMTYKLVVKNCLNNVITDPFDANTKYFVMTQEWLSTDVLTPISSIVFTTTQLETVGEFTGGLVQLSSGTNNMSVVDNRNSDNIITDMSLPLTEGASDYLQFIQYSPAGVYRLSDFIDGCKDVRNIDFLIYWKCKYDSNLYPIRLSNLSYGSIKILFQRKN